MYAIAAMLRDNSSRSDWSRVSLSEDFSNIRDTTEREKLPESCSATQMSTRTFFIEY